MFVMIGDGQVTQGAEIIKPNMQKVYVSLVVLQIHWLQHFYLHPTN
jgi:ATP-dependent protease HslVU (ClpYQ) peptidase subunit